MEIAEEEQGADPVVEAEGCGAEGFEGVGFGFELGESFAFRPGFKAGVAELPAGRG